MKRSDEGKLSVFIDNHVSLISFLDKLELLAPLNATQCGKEEDYERYVDLNLATQLNL